MLIRSISCFITILEMSNHFKWIPRVGKHGSRHQNEVSVLIINEDIGGLVIDLINMLMGMLIR